MRLCIVLQLVLVARDHGSQTWHEGIQFLTIVIKDIDDNLPRYTSTDPYVFHVKENLPASTRIGMVLSLFNYLLLIFRSKFFILCNFGGSICKTISHSNQTLVGTSFFLGKVEAYDTDENENARIFYYLVGGDGSSLFMVGRTDGEIVTNVTLDREEKDSYVIFIKATNDPDYYASKVSVLFADLMPEW